MHWVKNDELIGLSCCFTSSKQQQQHTEALFCVPLSLRDAAALKHIRVWNRLHACDLNPSPSSWLLTQNHTGGKLLQQNERRDRVQDRFDFTPGPGARSGLATNRTGSLAFPSSSVFFTPTLGGRLLRSKSQVFMKRCPPRSWCLMTSSS